MNNACIRTALALVSLGAVFAAGCSAAPPPERKAGTTSHLEGDESNEPAGETPPANPTETPPADPAPEGDTTVAATDGGETPSDSETAKNDEVAFVPLIVVGVVVLGIVAICATHSALCTNAAKDRCGGQATVKSECSGSLKSVVEVKCEISCPAGTG